jgi:starvation-inducible DNA-binding protein
VSKSKQIHEKESQAARLLVPDGYSPEDVKDLSSVLNALVADAFALYLKTKNFHWHMSGQHFRDYHLLLDEHATQIFGITDAIAERVRKVGGITIHSIGQNFTPTTRRLWKACARRMWSPLKPMTTQPPV